MVKSDDWDFQREHVEGYQIVAPSITVHWEHKGELSACSSNPYQAQHRSLTGLLTPDLNPCG
jgi:hypothetical protein